MARALRVLWAVPVGLTAADCFCSVTLVNDASMSPELKSEPSDLVLVNKLAVKRYDYQRGDVVQLSSPSDPSRTVLRRLVAIQGDWVVVPRAIRRRVESSWSFPLKQVDRHNELIQVPQGHAWVEGDNQDAPSGSRLEELVVPLSLILGRASCVLWPLGRFKLLHPRNPPGRVPIRST